MDAIILVFWMQMHVAVALNIWGDGVINIFFAFFFVKVTIGKYVNWFFQANLACLDIFLVF